MVALVFSSLVAFVVPAFEAPDEPYHFWRSYAITEGIILPQVNMSSPRAVYHFDKAVPVDASDRVDYELRLFNSSPLMYLPQSLGIFVGDLVSDNVRTIFMAGRLANVLLWVSGTALVLTLLPFKKITMAFYFLMPMSVFLSGTLSYDVIGNLSVFLLLALVLHLKFSEEVRLINGKQILALGVLAFLISQTGKIYLPAVLGALVLPKDKFGKPGGKPLLVMGLVLIVVVSFSVWGSIVEARMGPGATMYNPHNPDPSSQISYILEDPLRYVGVLISSLKIAGRSILISFVGNFGWLDVRLPRYIYLIWPIALVLVTLLDSKHKQKLSLLEKGLFSGITLACIGLVFTAMYVMWTAFGLPRVYGVQGRYFIAGVPFLLFAVGGIRVPALDRMLPVFSSVVGIGSLVVMGIVLSLHYHSVYYKVFPSEENHSDIQGIDQFRSISQAFVSECEAISDISVLLSRSNEAPLRYFLSLNDFETGETLFIEEIPSDRVRNEVGWVTVYPPAARDLADRTISLQIQNEGNETGLVPYLSGAQYVIESDATVDGKPFPNDLMFKYVCSRPFWFSFFHAR